MHSKVLFNKPIENKKRIQGNQENRQVILDNKLIDYVNCILRMKSYGECPLQLVVSLLESIVNLLFALVEENGTRALRLAKVVIRSL
jgi:hypothetical protein